MRFFLDNNVGKHLAEVLRLVDAPRRGDIQHLQEKFLASISDVEWIEALRSEGDWVVITADVRIRRNKAERGVWEEAGLTTFFLSDGWSNQKSVQQAHALLGWWPEIIRLARDADAGTGFESSGPKKFKLFYAARSAG